VPTSVRLDRKTERLVERLAREKGRTKSEVIRSAIVLAVEKELGEDKRTPYERSAHLIGCVSGGPPDLSVSTGARVREILSKKARSR
jgi:Arc/MetJ-type ribon-helix-helix transcriptional regulator